MLRFLPQYVAAPWGGRRLEIEFGRTLPDEKVGEAWELVGRFLSYRGVHVIKKFNSFVTIHQVVVGWCIVVQCCRRHCCDDQFWLQLSGRCIAGSARSQTATQHGWPISGELFPEH